MQRAAHAYLQTQVTTNSPGDLLILLYDGAINFLNKAKEYLAVNDMAGKGIYISKALDIINELDSTLNLDKGGELAANLHNLYFFCSSRLVMANLKKDAKMVDEIVKILSGLRSAYAEIVALPEAQAAAQTTAANMRPAACMPARAQAGTAPTGGAAPAPGASARIRTMHARNQQNMTDASAETPVAAFETAAGTASAGEQAATAAGATGMAAGPVSMGAPMSPAAGTFAGNAASQAGYGVGAAAARFTQQLSKPFSTAGMSAPAAQKSVGQPAAPQAGPGLAVSAVPVKPEAEVVTAASPQANAPQAEAMQPDFNGNASFVKRAGSDLYRKFAGQ